MNKPFAAPNLVSGRFGKIALCLSVGGVLWACTQRTNRPPRPISHLSPAQVCRRAETVASVYGSSVEVEEAPVLLKHSAWTLACRSDDLILYMTFDDATGRLWNLGIRMPPGESGVAPLKTAAEARQVARRRLQELPIVPQGSHLALAQPPIRSEFGWSWEMIWTVTPPDGSRPYPIQLILDSRTGLPMRVIDVEKAHQYAAEPPG